MGAERFRAHFFFGHRPRSLCRLTTLISQSSISFALRPAPNANDNPAVADARQDVPRGSADPRHPLRNRDLDTGGLVAPAGYPLTDLTYCRLVHGLAAHPAQPIPPGIKEDILAYYADLNLDYATRKNPKSWKMLEADLATLRTMKTSTDPLPYPTYTSEEGDPGENPTP